MPKAAKISLVVLVALAGLLIGVDRALAYVAGRTLADEVSTKLQAEGMTTSEKPTVSIKGFPFVTQVLAGEYSSIDIDSADLTSQAASGAVTFTDVKMNAQGVREEDGDYIPDVAEKVSGEATVPYTSIAALLPPSDFIASEVTVSAQGDKLKLTVPISILGQTVEIAALVTPAMDNGRLTLTIDEITTADGTRLPQPVQALLGPINALLSGGFELPELPLGLQVDQIEVTDGGLRVWASAVNVPLS